MSDGARLLTFDCPGCGLKMAVELAQVRRHETVTCQRCNTDLFLATSGDKVEPTPDPNTGESATLLRLKL